MSGSSTRDKTSDDNGDGTESGNRDITTDDDMG